MKKSALVLFALIAAFSAGVFAPALAAREGSIAAVVNQDAISMTDLEDRIKLMIVSSGLPDSKEIRTRLAVQVLGNLVDEQLMLQEARRIKAQVSPQEIDHAFAGLAQKNGAEPEQFAKAIAASGVKLSTMQRQISAQLGWSKVIQEVLRPRVAVTDTDVDAFIARLQRNKGKNEYLVAEIFLPVDEPAQDAETRQLAQRLASEMQAGKAPFFKVAQQFSKAAGAEQGGDLGWVQQGQLAQELDDALAAMEPNAVSPPVRTSGGYHLLLLREKRAISDESIPSREKIMNALGVQRLERLQRRHLLDLKSAAFIETRVQS